MTWVSDWRGGAEADETTSPKNRPIDVVKNNAVAMMLTYYKLLFMTTIKTLDDTISNYLVAIVFLAAITSFIFWFYIRPCFLFGRLLYLFLSYPGQMH